MTLPFKTYELLHAALRDALELAEQTGRSVAAAEIRKAIEALEEDG